MESDITSFSGEWRYFSNFYRCWIFYEGVYYPSVENAFQAAKTESVKLRIPFKTYPSNVAKSKGKGLRLRGDWEDIKLEVMETLVREKFSKNNYLKSKLLCTGTRLLVEGNTWKDEFWGVYQGKGTNHLGRILMKIRQEIINSYEIK